MAHKVATRSRAAVVEDLRSSALGRRQRPRDVERFISKLAGELNPETGCLEWLPRPNGAGYGTFRLRSITENAHKVAYRWVHGWPRKGKVVRHRCDNPLCVNPDHLELGSHAENMRDMVKRGRAATTRGPAISEIDRDLIFISLTFGGRHEDIARVLGWSRATAGRALRQAYVSLQAELDDFFWHPTRGSLRPQP